VVSVVGPDSYSSNRGTDVHFVFSDGLTLTSTTVVSPFGFCMAPHTATSGRTHPATPSPRLDIPQTAQGQQETLESGTGRTPSYLVISGGTGCNAICAAFAQSACYVLPVSDNGGSSSEIIRVLGGPSIGNLFFSCLFPPSIDVLYRRRHVGELQPHHWRPALTVTPRR